MVKYACMRRSSTSVCVSVSVPVSNPESREYEGFKFTSAHPCHSMHVVFANKTSSNATSAIVCANAVSRYSSVELVVQ